MALTKAARTPKGNTQADKQIQELKSFVEAIIDSDEKALQSIEERLDTLEKIVYRKAPSIQKVETFNGEEEIQREESNLKMQYEDKIASVQNACKILPPNLLVDGKHVPKNVSAICGFLVTEEMIDRAYE
jgi:LPS O-antigen subunit length determinant protein (WzzB/FepE family)